MLSPDDQRRLAAIEEQLLVDDPAFAGGWPDIATGRGVDVGNRQLA